ncbi:MAG: hypothetical protein JNJ83_23815 [Verrucomicrobiaceae bacterium]|nr:hypothetical protein [Verrucomicrobiaceae bacterium]
MFPNPAHEPKALINYIFVDYENVHEVDLSLIGGRTVYLTLLLGARQTRLDVALVEKLMAHAASVQLVRLQSSGKNALDFALAFHLGRAVQADPNAYFHIISKDTGFDPLIEHLRSRQINARRHSDYTELKRSATKRSPSAPEPTDLVTRALEHLRKNTNNRPKRKQTLGSHLAAFCGKSSTAGEVEELIEKLQTAGHLEINEKGAVTYHLDPR